jgi:hypothetical protein
MNKFKPYNVFTVQFSNYDSDTKNVELNICNKDKTKDIKKFMTTVSGNLLKLNFKDLYFVSTNYTKPKYIYLRDISILFMSFYNFYDPNYKHSLNISSNLNDGKCYIFEGKKLSSIVKDFKTMRIL